MFFAAECRFVKDTQLHHKAQYKRAAQEGLSEEPQADGAADGEEESASLLPVILSEPIKIEANEGSTVQFPCKVTQGSRKYTRTMLKIVREIERKLNLATVFLMSQCRAQI